MRPNPMRGYHVDAGVLHGVAEVLRAAGLEKKAALLRAAQARATAAYDRGNLDEGDRQAARADVLVDDIENALLALEEEGEAQEEPINQSLTRQMAEAWQECMRDDQWGAACRAGVEEYRRTGQGRWVPPSQTFLGPPSRWIGLPKTSPEAVRQVAEHPEWYRNEPGYFEEPGVLRRLRDLLGYPDGPNADGRQLLDAAEDAWQASLATASRIRAGAAKRRAAGVDPLREAKRFVRRVSRRR